MDNSKRWLIILSFLILIAVFGGFFACFFLVGQNNMLQKQLFSFRQDQLVLLGQLNNQSEEFKKSTQEVMIIKPATVTSTAATSTASTTAAQLAYTNAKYGFSLQLPATWQGYKTNIKETSAGTYIYFGFASWPDIFAIGVYNKAHWDLIKNDPISARSYLGSNGQFYFVGNESQAIGDASLTSRRAEFAQILKTFKAF